MKTKLFGHFNSIVNIIYNNLYKQFSTLSRGTGAILCTANRLSVFDSQNLIVPIWAI